MSIKGVLFVVLFVNGVAMAAPGLIVTRPPILPLLSADTGPAFDPDATAGQWFYNPLTQIAESRAFEFHDNVLNYGGGSADFLAIKGIAAGIQLNNGKITAFDIIATITNDMPALTEWTEGTNSHGEWTNLRSQYTMDMWSTKLVTEFAISDLQNLPNGFSAPYRQGYTPYIIAANEDQLAWYCYTPNSPPQGQSTAVGNFYVPTWDFGNIPVGTSANRILSFTVDGAGLDPTDIRFQAIMDSHDKGIDLLSNQSASLKLSTWINNLGTDTGIPYPGITNPGPGDGLGGSDCGVFYQAPEPTTLVLLGMGAIALIRRRR